MFRSGTQEQRKQRNAHKELSKLPVVPQKVDGSNFQVAVFLAGCQHLMRTLRVNYQPLLVKE